MDTTVLAALIMEIGNAFVEDRDPIPALSRLCACGFVFSGNERTAHILYDGKLVATYQVRMTKKGEVFKRNPIVVVVF